MTESNWIPRVAESLAEELGGIVPTEVVAGYLGVATAHLESVATVDTFIPVLAARIARERVQALAQAEGLTPKVHPEVLFVCVHNAGRSQMAAVLTSALSGGAVHVRSAGSTPVGAINANVVRAMDEVGLDLSQEFPKPLTDEAVRAADVVITMGCGDACPVYPGKRYLDWELADPAGQPIEVVREVRDEIRERVLSLLADLGVDAGDAVAAGESRRA